MNTDINWQLIYEDTFDSSRSVDKTGMDIADGFYKLWFFTLLESVKEVTQNVNGKIWQVPGKGFNFFTLVFEMDKQNRKLQINSDKYLKHLFRLKEIIFAGYNGRTLAARQKETLETLANLHCLFYLKGKEESFYSCLEEIYRYPGLNLISLKIKLCALLSKNGLKFTGPADSTSSANDESTPPASAGKKE